MDKIALILSLGKLQVCKVVFQKLVKQSLGFQKNDHRINKKQNKKTKDKRKKQNVLPSFILVICSIIQ